MVSEGRLWAVRCSDQALSGMEGQRHEGCSLLEGSRECWQAGSPCQHCPLRQPGTPATPERPAPPALACRPCLQAGNTLPVTAVVTQPVCSAGWLPMPARGGICSRDDVAQSLQYWPRARGHSNTEAASKRGTRRVCSTSLLPALATRPCRNMGTPPLSQQCRGGASIRVTQPQTSLVC